MYCGLGTSRPRAAAAACATGLYGRLYGIRLYFAVFRCMTLHTCITHRHAFPPAPYSHTSPYSAIQRCMSIQLYSTIQHTPHTTPLRLDDGIRVALFCASDQCLTLGVLLSAFHPRLSHVLIDCPARDECLNDVTHLEYCTGMSVVAIGLPVMGLR